MKIIIIAGLILLSLSALAYVSYAYMPPNPPEYAYVLPYAEAYARRVANPEFLQILGWVETENKKYSNTIAVTIGVGHPGYFSEVLILYVNKDTCEVVMPSVFVGGGQTKPKYFFSQEKMFLDARNYVSEKTGVPLEEVYLWQVRSNLSGWWEGNMQWRLLLNVRGEEIFVRYSNNVNTDLLDGFLLAAREKLAETFNPTGNDQLKYDYYADHNTNDVTFIFTLPDGSKVDVLVDKDTSIAAMNKELEAAVLQVRGTINASLGLYTSTGERIEHDVHIDGVTRLPVEEPIIWGDHGEDKIFVLDSYELTANVEQFTIKTRANVGVYEADPGYYAVWSGVKSFVNNTTGKDLFAEGLAYLQAIVNADDPDATWRKTMNNTHPNTITFHFGINDEEDGSQTINVYINIDTGMAEMSSGIAEMFLAVRNLVKDKMGVGLADVRSKSMLSRYVNGVYLYYLKVRVGGLKLSLEYDNGNIKLISIVNNDGHDLLQNTKNYLADKLGLIDPDSLGFDYRGEGDTVVFTFTPADGNGTIDVKVDSGTGAVIEAIRKKEYHYYDVNGNLISSTYITETYDGTGTIRVRNTKWESHNERYGYSSSGEYNYYYNESGNLISMNGSYRSTYGSRVYEGQYAYTYSYDANKHLISIEGSWRYSYDGKVSEGQSSYHSDYDSTGNIVKQETVWQSSYDGKLGSGSSIYTYSYDANGRLISMEGSWQSSYDGKLSSGSSIYTYSYDANGRLISMEGSWQSSYNGNISESQSSYRRYYDSNGNMIKQESAWQYSYSGKSYEGTNAYNYIYDAEGKLAACEGESTYLYKEAGLLTRKIESTYRYDYAGGDSESWTMTTNYAGDGTVVSKNANIYIMEDGVYERYRVEYEDIDKDGDFDVTHVYDKDNNEVFKLIGDIAPGDVVDTIKNPPIQATIVNETDDRLDLEGSTKTSSTGGITLVPSMAGKKSSMNILQ